MGAVEAADAGPIHDFLVHNARRLNLSGDSLRQTGLKPAERA